MLEISSFSAERVCRGTCVSSASISEAGQDYFVDKSGSLVAADSSRTLRLSSSSVFKEIPEIFLLPVLLFVDIRIVFNGPF